MTRAIPYTPAAIKLLRQRAQCVADVALAQEFGWDLASLRDRARRHQIDLIKDDTGTRGNSSVLKDNTAGRIEFADATFDQTNRCVKRGRASITLSFMELAVARALIGFYLERPGEWIDRLRLESRARIACNSDIMSRIRAKLATLYIGIAYNRSVGGGFRLEVLSLDATREAAE
jgi:hypothetical protein